MKEREYKFKIDKVKPGKLSKPEIIKSLKEFSSIKKLQPFTMREFDKWEEKPISSQSIGQIFGSWTEAMREAGLKSTKNLKKDPVEMVEIFKDAWESYDAIPSGKQLDIYLKSKSAPYTTRVYCHTFGSIGRLVERVSAKDAIDAQVRLYDVLFAQENPDDVPEGKDWKELLNPDSLRIMENCKLEPSLASAEPGQRYQFERLGYFCVDPRFSD